MTVLFRPPATRRGVLRAAAAATLAAALPCRGILAAAAGDRRFVLVLLRGALDGLAAVPPHGDPRYRERRGALALAAPGEKDGCLPLDRLFALHPALAPLHPAWGRGELAFVHAVGGGYRTRSHFDAQDLLETGLSVRRGESGGWLNRALAPLGGDGRRLGLAVGPTVPLVLRGAVPVAAWEPDGMKPAAPEYLRAVARLWEGDPLLGPALAAGMRGEAFTAEVLGGAASPPAPGAPGRTPFAALCDGAGRLLAAPDGPRIAVLDLGGWDTHSGEGTAKGRLAAALGTLAGGLAALEAALGAAWRQTVVVTATEFGRTVAPNGTGGTDHGTASVALLLGGVVSGGRGFGDWPGFYRLEDGRDLRVATDLRAVLAGLLRDHLGLDGAALRRVFPDAAGLRPIAGLLRA